jgi:hypothetical protein
MAYAVTNPPALISGPLTSAGRLWIYRSTDPTATVDGAGYITNAGELGMKVGDVVWNMETDTDLVYSHVVKTISSTAPGAADLTDGTLIGSGTVGD